jgi:predicted nucleotidyltransferase
MRREEVIAKLRRAEAAIRAHGVAGLFLFGSDARDEARADSDIDVFVDPVSDEAFGFLPHMATYDTIEQALDPDIEPGYSTRSELSPYVSTDVEREAIRVF